MTANPTALSEKRVWVVMWPDVEKALVLWVKHMAKKGEYVTGPMLLMKHEKYEKDLGVPEEDQLKSDGWVLKFCKTYVLHRFGCIMY